MTMQISGTPGTPTTTRLSTLLAKLRGMQGRVIKVEVCPELHLDTVGRYEVMRRPDGKLIDIVIYPQPPTDTEEQS